MEAARTVFQDEHVNVNPIPAVMCELQQISSFFVFITSFLKKGSNFYSGWIADDHTISNGARGPPWNEESL